ncbi:hypothetical protein D9M68_763920 [compost metagenome]
MDFGLHAVAQRGIDQLMALDEALAFEGGADDDRVKMRAVALHVEMFTGQAFRDVLADLRGGGKHGRQFLSL